jgi:bifunctional DNA-binding transcriptional regulator/antitoxin component of YhaV-PrlF toxin-antitoxin module
MGTVIKRANKDLIVPPSIRRNAGIRVGDQVEFEVEGRTITIRPKVHSEPDEHSAEQRGDIDARLAESDEDIRHGRIYGPFETVAEMSTSIEANIKNLRRRRAPAKRPR